MAHKLIWEGSSKLKYDEVWRKSRCHCFEGFNDEVQIALKILMKSCYQHHIVINIEGQMHDMHEPGKVILCSGYHMYAHMCTHSRVHSPMHIRKIDIEW